MLSKKSFPNNFFNIFFRATYISAYFKKFKVDNLQVAGNLPVCPVAITVAAKITPATNILPS